MVCSGLKVAVATYNLYWWCAAQTPEHRPEARLVATLALQLRCVSDKFGNCPQFAYGRGFQQLYQRIASNPVDLFGFQECDDVEQVMAGAGLANFGYYSTPGGNDAPMAWSWDRLGIPQKSLFVLI